MYLFKEKDEVEIPYTCKLCLKEIPFKITKKEYQDANKFPITKQLTHGDPVHKLIVHFNQYLEVENFEVEEILEKETISFSKELTKQVLSEIDLTDEEIELYFRITGREAVSVGEMAILTGNSKATVQKIADKFVRKGLFKEIVGARPHYAALPPYAALVSQLQKFHKYISDIKSSIPIQLQKTFAQLESQSGKVEVKPKAVPTELMKELKDNMLTQIRSQKKEFDDTLAVMDQIRGITDDISNLEGYTESVMGTQMGDLKKQFETINTKTSQIIKGQVNDLKTEFDTIKSTVSSNLQKLRLGVIQQTVDQVDRKSTR
jgi:predicted transcriptional regulator